MNGKLIIWIEDESALYIGEAAQDTDKHPAVQWLETQFTCQWVFATLTDPDVVPGPECIRPMIELIDQHEDSAEDDYGPMIICQADYDDPGRWWL